MMIDDYDLKVHNYSSCEEQQYPSSSIQPSNETERGWCRLATNVPFPHRACSKYQSRFDARFFSCLSKANEGMVLTDYTNTLTGIIIIVKIYHTKILHNYYVIGWNPHNLRSRREVYILSIYKAVTTLCKSTEDWISLDSSHPSSYCVNLETNCHR